VSSPQPPHAAGVHQGAGPRCAQGGQGAARGAHRLLESGHCRCHCPVHSRGLRLGCTRGRHTGGCGRCEGTGRARGGGRGRGSGGPTTSSSSTSSSPSLSPGASASAGAGFGVEYGAHHEAELLARGEAAVGDGDAGEGELGLGLAQGVCCSTPPTARPPAAGRGTSRVSPL